MLNNGAVKSCDEREQKKGDRQKLKEKSEDKEANKKVVKSVVMIKEERELNQLETEVIDVKNIVKKVLMSEDIHFHFPSIYL